MSGERELNSFASRRVLVTGASGFIGSHLAEMLVEAGAEVTALSEYNSFNDWGWLERSPQVDRMRVVTGDIRDPHLCHTLVERSEIVFNLAALIPIPYSYRAPASYVDTNVKGTLNLAQASRAHGVQRFIQVSTSEVYGTAQYVPIDEYHPLAGQSPYSATKIGADAIAMSFYYSFNLPVSIARPFNTYGPRQSARAVISNIIAQLAAGIQEVRLGDTRTTRDFTFVRDTCRGLMAIANMQGGLGEVYNIGSNFEISIGDLFELIAREMEMPARIVADSARIRPGKSEVLRLWCNNEKLRAATGFQPEIPLREGIRRTVQWFRQSENLARYKPDIYNV
jgi:NAD dependent epimerase/dehydratase